MHAMILSSSVRFSFSVDESVCEGAGSVTACVQLESGIERSAEAVLQTFDSFAKGSKFCLKVIDWFQ